MSETWDPIGYLREKYGIAGPVEEWRDAAFEEILDDDPLSLSVPVIAKRVATWDQQKKAHYYAQMAVAGIMFDTLSRDCVNLCCDNERERHWIAGRLARRLTRICSHEFTEIALENTDDGQAFGKVPGRAVWEWCIRCGIMRLGSEIYRPGPHQQKALTSAVTQGPRSVDEG